MLSEISFSLFDKLSAFPGVPIADYCSYSVFIVFMFDPIFAKDGIVLLLLDVFAVVPLVLPSAIVE